MGIYLELEYFKFKNDAIVFVGGEKLKRNSVAKITKHYDKFVEFTVNGNDEKYLQPNIFFTAVFKNISENQYYKILKRRAMWLRKKFLKNR